MNIPEKDDWPFLDELTRERESLQREMFQSVPLFQLVGISLQRIDRDYLKASLAFRQDLARPGGILHGGIISTLVDVVAGQAIYTTLKPGYDLATVHLDTKYFEPVAEGQIFAEGRVARKGKNLAHSEATVADERGRIIARGWCVFALKRTR